MVRRKTHEEYVKELSIKNPNIEVVGRYINSTTKVTHRCLKDGFEWDVLPTAILRGHGCPQCNGGVKITHDEYVDKLFKINPSIIVIGQYVNSQTKIAHKCLIDGHEWLLSPGNALNGKGCPVCGGTMRKTHEQYVDELKLKNPLLIVIGQYINHRTKITHKCLIHECEFEMSPSHALKGCGCSICKNEKLRDKFRRSHDEYVNEVAAINKDIIVIGQYINARTHIAHKCRVCGWEWDTIPNNILRGHGCPQCNICNKSIGEKIIATWLNERGILYEKQKTFGGCKDKYVLRFDFYLSDYNILIEYNGIQHYDVVDYFGGKEGFEDAVRRDKIKTDYCRENNIPLVVIPYFTDVYKELGRLHKLINARDMAKEAVNNEVL